MAVASPCIKVCVIDPEHKVCAGCGRTLQEIAQWSGMSDAQKRAVVAALSKRLEAFGAEPSPTLPSA